MNYPGGKKPFVEEEPDRSLTGGLCFICKKPLIKSLIAAPVMTKANIRSTREEKSQKDFIAKFVAKDMQSRTAADMKFINQAVPLDPNTEVIAVSCGHLYHRCCFREFSEKFKLLKKRPLAECPQCRKTVLYGNAVGLDTRPMDCGLDKLPVPASKETKEMRKKGVDMLENLRETRKNYGCGLLFYIEQMFRIKNYKREVLEYHHPFWMNGNNVDKLRARRNSMKKEANERELDNLNQAILFLTNLESDPRLSPVAAICLRRLRTTREGIDSFRLLVQNLQKLHAARTGEVDAAQLITQLVQILCAGFKAAFQKPKTAETKK